MHPNHRNSCSKGITNSVAYPLVYPQPHGCLHDSKTNTSNSLREGSTADSLYSQSATLAKSKDLILDQVTGMRHISYIECLGFPQINTEPSTGNWACQWTPGDQASSNKSEQKLASQKTVPAWMLAQLGEECHELCPPTRSLVLSPSANGTNQHIGAEL